MGYSTSGIVVIKVVVGIEVEVVVVATEPRRTCSPLHPFEHHHFNPSGNTLVLWLYFIIPKIKGSW